MATVSTHVLDTARGCPAAGVEVRLENEHGEVLGTGTTDTDGRVRDLAAGGQPAGTYRLVFGTSTYFAACGDPGFFPEVVVTFEVLDPDGHYHVPLLASPYGYSTYRGS